MKHSPFSTKQFGLSERDTQLFVSALNGIAPHEKITPTTQWLSQQIYAATEEGYTDLKEFGADLSLDESNPELPLEYQDLLEKIQQLADWQSAALYFYALGFLEGESWRSSINSDR